MKMFRRIVVSPSEFLVDTVNDEWCDDSSKLRAHNLLKSNVPNLSQREEQTEGDGGANHPGTSAPGLSKHVAESESPTLPLDANSA